MKKENTRGIHGGKTQGEYTKGRHKGNTRKGDTRREYTKGRHERNTPRKEIAHSFFRNFKLFSIYTPAT